MTRHVGEDMLLKLALGLLDVQADTRVHHHLEGCPTCRALLEDVERTLHQIKDVTPEVSADVPLLPSVKRNRLSWLRVAAMLAVGFGLGFLASESLRSPFMNVVPQQLVSKAPEWTGAGFVTCDEIDLTSGLH
jgi:anti-sigma factor RsiW